MPTNQRQRRLLLVREEKLAAIKAIGHDNVGVSRTVWRHVAALLVAIEIRTDREHPHLGSHAYAETLAQAIGVSRRTFFRVRAVAVEKALVIIENRYDGRGQQSNAWHVDWGRVAALAPAPAEVSASECQKNGTPRRQKVTPPCQSGTPLIGIISSSVSSLTTNTIDEEGDDRRRRTGSKAPAPRLDWARVRTMAERIEQRVGPCRVRRDWSLAVKAAAMVYAFGDFSEDWLWNAVRGVELMARPNPWKYLDGCLTNAAAAVERDFKRLLRERRVPADLLRYSPAPIERRQRLVATGRDE